MTENTTAPVSASWARIDAWLGAHAPASLARLRPGATPEALAAAEAALGVPLPDELAASLACHDGVVDPRSPVLPEGELLSAEGLVEQWQLRNEVEAERLADEGEDEEFADDELFWHRLWIPVAHFQGDLNVIDTRPGPGQGCLGWVSHDGSHYFDRPGGTSLSAYLQAVADTLATGRQPIPGTWTDPRISPAGELVWSTGLPPLRAGTTLESLGFRPAPVGLPESE